MKLSYGQDDFANLTQHVVQLAGQLPALEVELRARWRTARADGFPTASLRDGSRPSSDENGDPLPSYSDPTGDTAVQDPESDSDALTLTKAYNLLCSADAALRSAQGLLSKALKPPADLEDEEPGDPGCSSCRRDRRPSDPTARWFEDTYQDNLCHFCFGWNAESGVWPAMDVLRDHHAGKKINASRIPARLEPTA